MPLPLYPALIVPGWPPAEYPNGIVTYADTLLRGLLAAGSTPTIIGPMTGPPPPFVRSPANYIGNKILRNILWRMAPNVWKRRLFRKGMMPVLNSLFGEGHLDIVETDEAFGVARGILDCCPVPVVVRLHGPWFLNGPALGIPCGQEFHQRDQQERLLVANATAVTAISLDALNRCKNHFRLDLAESIVIPNPAPISAPENIWKRDTSDRSTILFIGRFDRHKGGDLIISAFGKVLEAVSGTQLVFVGPDRGFIKENGCTVYIESFAESVLGERYAPTHFKWLGQVPHGDLPALRLQAACIVVSSRYENFPYAVIEAMSQGCPIVASDAGGIPEIIQHGRNGLLFRSGDSQDLAAKIEVLLGNPDLAARLGDQARRDCLDRYRPEVVAKQMLAFYEEVISRWRAKR